MYGSPDGTDLKESVKDQEYLNILAKYTIDDWLSVLTKWYLTSPHITLYGKPSAEFAEQQAQDEEERIEKQIEGLGQEKLDELQNKLDDAMAKNDVPVPKELLEGFKIPSASTIKFINVVTARNNDTSLLNPVQEYVNKDDGADVPLFIQFDRKLFLFAFLYLVAFWTHLYFLCIYLDVKSHFVKLSAHISASSIPSNLLPYTRLFLKAIFSLPIEKDGQLIPYEDVVKGLGEDTVEYDASLGTNFGFRELAVFTLKAKASKFEKSIQWLHDVLWNTQFTAERLKIVASQILNDIPQAKRDGHDVSCCLFAIL